MINIPSVCYKGILAETIAVVNYNANDGLTTIFENAKTEAIAVSDEIKDIFNNIDISKSMGRSFDWDMFDDLDFPDEDLKNWISTLDESKRASITSSEALSNYQKYLNSSAQTTSRFSRVTSLAGKTLKAFAATTANAAIGIVAFMAIKKVIDLFDRWANRVEYAKEAMDKTNIIIVKLLYGRI